MPLVLGTPPLPSRDDEAREKIRSAALERCSLEARLHFPTRSPKPMRRAQRDNALGGLTPMGVHANRRHDRSLRPSTGVCQASAGGRRRF